MAQYCGRPSFLRQVLVAIVVIQILGLTFYLIRKHMQHNHINTSNPSKRFYIESHGGSKKCFFLSWTMHTLTKLSTGSQKSPWNSTEVNEQTALKKKDFTEGKSCNRFILLDRAKGRTGNQMFQVASLIGMAYTHDSIPIITQSFPLRRYFKLPNIVTDKHSKDIRHVKKCSFNKSSVYNNFSEEFNSGKNVSLHAFLQSWRYFENIENIIKCMFRLETEYIVKARKFLQSIARPGYQHVCIHIRRGDIVRKGVMEKGFATGNTSFIERAREFYLRKFVNVQFIAVSDDKDWCRKNLKDIILSPFIDVGDDMALMISCDHVIVTSGTFGWWGAWLSGGTTVYFAGHPVPGSWLDFRMNKDDFYPPNWVGMT